MDTSLIFISVYLLNKRRLIRSNNGTYNCLSTRMLKALDQCMELKIDLLVISQVPHLNGPWMHERIPKD